MSESLVSNRQISNLVSNQLELRGWSVRKCAEEFNKKYNEEIRCGSMKAMNKDFVQRVRNNNFGIANLRVKSLCEFLKLELFECNSAEATLNNNELSYRHDFFKSEMDRIDDLIKKRPALKNKIKSILTDIVDIVSV